MADETDNLNVELDQLSGVEIAGRFRLGRMLGKGGYGAVYEGEQVSVRRPCAVKVLVPHIAANPRNTQRFEREARLTSQLAHPNTVVIYDFGLDEQRKLLFLAMEHIDGESLREIIRAQRTLTLETTLHVTHQIARSLQDAHERGLVHRDVKPHNVMITARAGDPMFVKVIDFGIAKFLDDDDVRATSPLLTMTGMIVGTPAYMAPEQVRNEVVDGRTDQYALAVCVYQMLTGRTVFQGATPVDIATHHLMQKPLPLRAFNPALPVTASFENVLLRALEKEPADRYLSILAFADELVRTSGLSLPHAFQSTERDRELRDIAEARTESLSLEPIHPPVDPLARTATTTRPAAPAVQPAGSDSTTVSGSAPSLPDTEPGAGILQVGPLAPGEPNMDDAPGYTLQIEPPQQAVIDRGEVELAGEQVVRENASSSKKPGVVTGAVLLAAASLAGVLGVVAFFRFSAPSPPLPEPVPAVGSPLHAGAEPQPAPAISAATESPKTTEAAPAPAPTPEPAPVRPEREAADFESRPARASTAVEPVQATSRAERRKIVKPAKQSTARPGPPKPIPGVVTVTLMPWGSLYVNGELVGDESKNRLSLEPGKHRLELRQNGVVRASETVEIRSGRDAVVELIAK